MNKSDTQKLLQKKSTEDLRRDFMRGAKGPKESEAAPSKKYGSRGYGKP